MSESDYTQEYYDKFTAYASVAVGAMAAGEKSSMLLKVKSTASSPSPVRVCE